MSCTVSSTSWASSSAADQCQGRVAPAFHNIGVCRGPSGKIQVTPSGKPSKWQLAHEIQEPWVNLGSTAELNKILPRKSSGDNVSPVVGISATVSRLTKSSTVSERA